MSQSQVCDLSIQVNGEETFVLNQKTISAYSGKLKRMIKQERSKTESTKNLIMSMKMNDFPGGSNGFELVSRFSYNNGRTEITVSNVCLLYCCAVFLDMNENLLKETEIFLEGIFYWSWNDILLSLKSCDSFFTYADSYGLVQKLICGLLAKIAQNSDTKVAASCSSSSSSSSSPETILACQESSTTSRKWWFSDMSSLSPAIIEKFLKNLGAYGSDNNSLVVTRFIIHYLRNRNRGAIGKVDYDNEADVYCGLADTAVYGVTLAGKSWFSCRGLLSILKTVSGFGLSKDCRGKLERLIGSLLDQATLDDLLISGHERGAYYDVKLVLRLIRIFVNDKLVSIQRMKNVGKLIDKYLGEISPDHNLKMSKFLGVAQSLPDSARDCFDGVYKAIDMYLQSHPALSFVERTRLCECLNYEKLSLEACKDLAKNLRIPPNIAIQALKSQAQPNEFVNESLSSQDKEDIKINIERMQRRVIQLEKACREMKGQMSFLVRHNVLPTSSPSRTLPRLC